MKRTCSSAREPVVRSWCRLLGLAVGAALTAWGPASHAADDTEIRIGNFAPYSGPASSYSAFAKTQAAYFRMINETGGINGRKVRFISYDDAYSPPKAVEQARKLVEDDNVHAIFQGVGTPSNAAIMKYMNVKKVPQILAATGATKFGDYRNFPWTMGFSPSVYRVEAGIYARYILDQHPNGKIALLSANDDYGKDISKGFKDAMGDRLAGMLVAEATYDTGDPTLDSQLAKLKASGADVFVDLTTPRFSALAIRRLAELGWKPVHILNTTGASISTAFKAAGIENAIGILSAQAIKEPTDPRWRDDPAVREFVAFMEKWNPDGDKTSSQNAYGYLAAQVLRRVLEQCGADISRENIMRQATNLDHLSFGLLFPGITVNTSPTNYFPITQMQLIRFNGVGWDPVGPIMSQTMTSE